MTDAPQKDEQGYFANLIWAPPGRGRAVKMPDSDWLLDGAGVRRVPDDDYLAKSKYGEHNG